MLAACAATIRQASYDVKKERKAPSINTLAWLRQSEDSPPSNNNNSKKRRNENRIIERADRFFSSSSSFSVFRSQTRGMYALRCTIFYFPSLWARRRLYFKSRNKNVIRREIERERPRAGDDKSSAAGHVILVRFVKKEEKMPISSDVLIYDGRRKRGRQARNRGDTSQIVPVGLASLREAHRIPAFFFVVVPIYP